MADVLRGLVSASGAFLVAWAFPSAILLSVSALVVLPELSSLSTVTDLQALDATEKALVLAFASIVLGLILSSVSTPLYRVLEGYSFPRRLQRWGTDRQRRIKAALEEEVSREGVERDRWRQALAAERLQRFPADDGQIAPTRLGNSLRAFETYGVDRYQLDSQTFWVQLIATAPPRVREDVMTARTSVDFYVCSAFLSALFAATCLSIGFLSAESPDWELVTWGVIGILVAPACYRGSLVGSSYWAATVRALVDLGRKPLADSMGLQLPATIEEERAMWEVVAAFAFYPYDASWSPRLDPYRIQPRALLDPGYPTARPTPWQRLTRFLRADDD